MEIFYQQTHAPHTYNHIFVSLFRFTTHWNIMSVHITLKYNSNISFNSGDFVQVRYDGGTDDTPVISNGLNYNIFTGFRIAPEWQYLHSIL